MDNLENNNDLLNVPNNSSSVDEFIFNISGIKEEYFNNFFKDIVSQNWGVKMEDVVNNDNLKVYMGFFTDEINEIIDQYDNILIQNTLDIDSDILQENNSQIANQVPHTNIGGYDQDENIDDNYYKKFKNLKQINDIFGKSKKLSKNDEIVKSEEKCNICFENFKPRQLKRKLLCNHYYHQKCIDKWLKINARCPVCRTKFL